MKIGVFGTGMVGQALAGKLHSLGHQVMMGSRTANNEKAAAWVQQAGAGASQGTYADAAAHGELLVNCTAGMASLEVLKLAKEANLNGKILLDIANPLDFRQGMPPSLNPVNTDSLAEQIQRAYPQLRVVKGLNTMNCLLMVDPSRLAEPGDVFVSGNDAAAKATIIELLKSFGWKAPIDLGDISTARGTEMLLPIWLRLWGALGTADFNFKIVK